MRQLLSISRIGILLVACFSLTGCGGGAGDAAAPPAEAAPPAATAMPGDAAMADPTTSAMPGPGAAVGLPTSGMPGDDYRAAAPDGGAFISDPSAEGVGQPGILPGDAGIMPGDGYVATPGAGNPGFPGDGAQGFGQAPPPKDPAPPEDADFITKANYAYAIGKESIAHQYLYAHILSNDAAASEYLKKFRWLPSGRRPTATVRFGVGVILSAPSTMTDYKPIGTPQFMGNAGGAGGGMEGMGMTGGGGGKAGPNSRSFRDLTGDFGEGVVAAFETRWSAGDFGTTFNEVTALQPFAPGPGGNFAGAGGFPGDGAFGAGGFPGGDPNAGGSTSGGNGERPRALPGKSITPGLHYLGVGSQGDLVTKATKEGLDAIFFFDVECKPNRMNGVVQNDTRVRLLAIAGDVVAATSTLNNVKVERAQSTGGINDVEKQVTSLMKRLDAGKKPDGKEEPKITLKLANLPAIKPEHAKTQVNRIVASKPKDVLAALTEVRLYHSLGLLKDEEKSGAFQLLMEGAVGETLATGSEEERIAALKPKLPSYK